MKQDKFAADCNAEFRDLLRKQNVYRLQPAHLLVTPLIVTKPIYAEDEDYGEAGDDSGDDTINWHALKHDLTVLRHQYPHLKIEAHIYSYGSDNSGWEGMRGVEYGKHFIYGVREMTRSEYRRALARAYTHEYGIRRRALEIADAHLKKQAEHALNTIRALGGFEKAVELAAQRRQGIQRERLERRRNYLKEK